jgi:hypothetical protein
LRKFGKYFKASKSRSFARAVLLFCLVAHANLVFITHQHEISIGIAKETAFRFEASRKSNSDKPLGTGGEACCLLCCLQRTFVSSIQPIAIPLDFAPVTVGQEIAIIVPCVTGETLVLSNRAPPLG